MEGPRTAGEGHHIGLVGAGHTVPVGVPGRTDHAELRAVRHRVAEVEHRIGPEGEHRTAVVAGQVNHTGSAGAVVGNNHPAGEEGTAQAAGSKGRPEEEDTALEEGAADSTRPAEEVALRGSSA